MKHFDAEVVALEAALFVPLAAYLLLGLWLGLASEPVPEAANFIDLDN